MSETNQIMEMSKIIGYSQGVLKSIKLLIATGSYTDSEKLEKINALCESEYDEIQGKFNTIFDIKPKNF